MNPRRYPFRSRDKPKASLNGSLYSFFFAKASNGKPVNETTAMQMTAGYSCVRILSENLVGLPLNVYQCNNSAEKKRRSNTRSYWRPIVSRFERLTSTFYFV